MRKERRGFASMDQARQRVIARDGIAALRAQGRQHKWTPEEARAAALKGHEQRRLRANLHMNQTEPR